MAAMAVDLQPPPGSSALVLKLAAMTLMSELELQYLEGLQNNMLTIDKGTEFIVDTEDMKSTFVIRDGWAARHVSLPDGRRQILSFALPGDILGLHINFRRKAAYSAVALTDIQASLVDPARMIEINQKYPVIATAMSWTTAREFAILGDQAVRLGRLNAYERLCHFLVELYYRARVVGEASGDEDRGWLDFPVTQQVVADTLGLSLVHVNRQFQQLKKDGLVSLDKGRLRLIDIDRLVELAEYTTDHLDEFRFI